MTRAGADAPAVDASTPTQLSDEQSASDPAPAGPPPGRRVSATVPVARLRQRLPSLGPRSLTVRLVAVVGLIVVVLVGAVGAATYITLGDYLTDRLKQQLVAAADGNARTLQNCDYPRCLVSPSGRGPSASVPLKEWIAGVTASGQSVISVSGEGPVKSMHLSADDVTAVLQDPDAVREVRTLDGHQLLVTGQAISTIIGPVVVFSGLSTEDVDDTLGRLVGLELVIGIAAVAVALALTASGVRLTLRGLRRVTDTAQDVSAELSPEGAGLERRVPNDEPHTEVGQLATSFNMMLAAVETQFAARVESEQRMRQFLADASHELRTPLTSIRGYAELARMQRDAGAATEDNLSRIESEGTRMSRLVEDLLTLARSDDAAPASQPELVEVDSLLDDAVSGARAAFPDRRIDVRPDVTALPVALGDRDQLLRVVRNLVTNAAVHTDPARPIEVRADAEAGGVAIRVIDGGPGLPGEQAAHVFERFWRADKARTRARGGSGLGLSIVATIVRAHGGTVRFDSSVQDGSTVTVWLPPAGIG